MRINGLDSNAKFVMLKTVILCLDQTYLDFSTNEKEMNNFIKYIYST